MRFSTIFAGFALGAGLATAFPSADAHRRGDGDNDSDKHFCLSDADATALRDVFVGFLTDPATTTTNAGKLADDFADFSSSINFLIGLPADAQTFTKTTFISGQGAQKPLTDFQVLSPQSWHTCTQVFFRWSTTVDNALPVFGINIMQIAKNNGVLQIETNWSEFDTGAWVLDIGGTCQAPPPA